MSNTGQTITTILVQYFNKYWNYCHSKNADNETIKRKYRENRENYGIGEL